MGGAQLGKEETYGRYDIIGYIAHALVDMNQFILKARTRQIPQEPPRILRVTVFYGPLETGFSRDEETVWKQVLGRIHGLLDFGLFEESNEYQWTVTPTEETIKPPLTLEAPDFGDDSEKRICYHILSALRRTRHELPREYTRKKLDPEGVCAILQIARTYFEYIVGRLEERGWIAKMQLVTDTGRIVLQGNLFDGGFYITEEGVQALEETERSQVKPQWLTKRAPEDVQKRAPEIVQVIDNWIPKQRYRTEEAYRAALAEHLEGHGITAPEQQGASLTDILAAHGIGIESKLKPDRSEYDRLAGQILRQLGEFGVVVVLILRPDRRDLLDEYKSLFAGDDRVVFMTK
jgi:hypothetical protein